MNSTLTHVTLAALAAVTGLSAQTTVNIIPTKDNSLYAEPPGTNSNGQGRIFCGQTASGFVRRMVMHFDVAGSVPAGAVVISATLDLNIEQSTAFLPINTFVHRLSQDWGEGASLPPGQGGGGTAAATGDVTWVNTFYPGSFWTTPGGDFAPANWQFPLVSLGAMTTEPAAGLIGDVQDMLDYPASNFGWLFKTAETLPQTARRISARNNINPPTLNITYMLQSEVGTWGVGCVVGGGTFGLNFSGAAIGGSNLAIQRNNAVPTSVGGDFFSLGLNPAGVLLQPGCTAYLPLAMELITGAVFLSGTGNSTGTFPVPTGFPGFMVTCQSVVLDGSPLGLSLSNAAVMILQ